MLKLWSLQVESPLLDHCLLPPTLTLQHVSPVAQSVLKISQFFKLLEQQLIPQSHTNTYKPRVVSHQTKSLPALYQNKEILAVSVFRCGYHSNEWLLLSSESLLCVVLVMCFFLRPQFICQTRFFFLKIMMALRAEGRVSIRRVARAPQGWKCPLTLTDTNKFSALSAARAHLALINMAATVNPLIFQHKTTS